MVALTKDLLMKVGIGAAVVVVIYLIFRSRKCRAEGYAGYVPALQPDEYAENMYEAGEADYAHAVYASDDYAEEQEDAEDDAGDDAGDDRDARDDGDWVKSAKWKRLEGQLLMESTLNDDEANAIFEPEM